jgi:hypothetical protein
MYRPEEHLFAFRLRRKNGAMALEGVSPRYTAIALLGLAGETEETATGILGGQRPRKVCEGLIQKAQETDDLGEVALTLWAARVLQHPRAEAVLLRLRSMRPAYGRYPTVEVAWALSALTAQNGEVADAAEAEAIAGRLLASFRPATALLPHWPAGARGFSFRSHVSCFADLVYPIQALSHYYRATRCSEALEAARACAKRMCDMQGPDGQWWWHYDVRTGRVIERYPVYAVHQHSMAPMALFALQDACGTDHTDATVKSLKWLASAPEIGGSLIDTQTGVVWRKVARREPFKVSRRTQALASRVHTSLRVPGLDRVFRPNAIDYESRPYEMGWTLYAWTRERICRMPSLSTQREVRFSHLRCREKGVGNGFQNFLNSG